MSTWWYTPLIGVLGGVLGAMLRDMRTGAARGHPREVRAAAQEALRILSELGK